MTSKNESICLKFGVLKSWNIDPEGRAAPIITEYVDRFCGIQGQIDSHEQRDLLCRLIDAISTEDIVDDWEGRRMGRDEAKAYVMNYRHDEKEARSLRM